MGVPTPRSRAGSAFLPAWERNHREPAYDAPARESMPGAGRGARGARRVGPSGEVEFHGAERGEDALDLLAGADDVARVDSREDGVDRLPASAVVQVAAAEIALEHLDLRDPEGGDVL